jgi:hypothetical protein
MDLRCLYQAKAAPTTSAVPTVAPITPMAWLERPPCLFPDMDTEPTVERL